MNRKNDILIKVLSLGVGLAVGIVLVAKIFFELSFDHFYKDIDRTYQIMTWYSQQGQEKDYDQVSGAVAVGFMTDVPGVEYGTRITPAFDSDSYLDAEGNRIQGRMVCADTCFFKVFERPILAGDAVKALSKWGCLMVSRSFAEKLVGPKGNLLDVVGMQVANEQEPVFRMTIEGVFEDFPKNGSVKVDLLMSMVTYPRRSTENWLGNERYLGFVKLYEGVDPHSLKDAIRKMQEAHQPFDMIKARGSDLRYYLVPFSKVHTSDPLVRGQIVLLSIVATLLVLISLLNYILIVVSTMVKRSKEVGVRKCYGAEAKNIYGMLAKEAIIHMLLSLLLAGAIIFVGRSIVENLFGVPFRTLLVSSSMVAIAALVLFILAVSIVVPAELYQRIPVYEALKNYTENSRRWKLGLLGVQMLINVFLVAMMIIIGKQYDKLVNSQIGYDYENLYFFKMERYDYQAQARVIQALRSVPGVKDAAASSYIPIYGTPGDNVYLPDEDRELFNCADFYSATENYYDLMGISFVEGRAPKDSTEMAVDEKFVARMAEFQDWSDGAVGKVLRVTGHGKTISMTHLPPYTISGVYKNYLLGSLNEWDDRPKMMFFGELEDERYWMRYVLFKVSPGDLPAAQDAVAKALEGWTVDIHSYQEEVRSSYDDSRKTRNTVVLGVIFSLLIALLGLIGFIRDESLRRSKEMAIRKINGAVTRDVLGIFSADIMKLGVVMAVFACIGAYFAASKWLQQFAEKIYLDPLLFLGAAVIVLAIVLGVVTLNSLRIAHANPVDSLKNE